MFKILHIFQKLDEIVICNSRLRLCNIKKLLLLIMQHKTIIITDYYKQTSLINLTNKLLQINR